MASVIPRTDAIWFNGTLVPWEEARVHVLAHALHYGTGVFEGLRCYPTPDGPAVFCLDAHLQRFFASAALYELPIPYSLEQLSDATLEVVRANRLENAYIRPIAFSLAISESRLAFDRSCWTISFQPTSSSSPGPPPK